MKRNIINIITALSAILILFAAADTASAQRRESRGKALTKAQVKLIVNRVETRTDHFVKNYDKALDRSKLNGSSREDWLNKRAKDLEHATDDMRKHFDVSDAWIENKDEVRKCLNIASDIDRNMRNYRFGTVAEANWANVRFELNSLADVYNLPRVGSGVYK